MSNLIREFKRGNWCIRVKAIDEHSVDLSFDVTGTIAKKLNSNELVAFMVVAEISYDNFILAEDYLGSCIYEDYKSFMDHIGSKKCYGSYFTDMVHTVIKEAKMRIQYFKNVKIRN